MAANVRDSDTSLWLHNKLGTSSEWTSGSICSQLNKEVLRNIKDCFSDLQTQVKLKLLLSFFHIPRRHVEEWKTELDEIIEVAALDSELWVSMIAETIKTFPATSSLNTEISDYEETRPIFIDMVNDLKKYVNKHSDLAMLPLECQYLNKMALTSVVGQQPAPLKHFTLKRKPKSANLRTELLQKSSDAQSHSHKISAPIIPLRTRGLPRKMSDTTPLRGIPSRMPTSGFRSPATQGPNRPNMPRQGAGRKDGGIKLLDITEQPLGYAAAKKRKRQQDLEEQQKRALEAQSSPTAIKTETEQTPPVDATPDYAVGLNATPAYTQPATPAPAKNDTAVAATVATPTPTTTTITTTTNQTQYTSTNVKTEIIKTEPMDAAVPQIIEPVPSKPTQVVLKNAAVVSTANVVPVNNNVISSNNSVANNHIVFSIKSDGNVASSSLVANATPTAAVASTIATKKLDGARIISSNILKPTMTFVTSQTTAKRPPALTSIVSTSNATTMPSLTAISNTLTTQQQLSQPLQIPQQIGATKIVQIKAPQTIQVQRSSIQNIPPLIPTQQPTILNIQQRQQPLTIQPQTSTPSTISYIQQQPQGQQSTIQLTTGQPKYAPVVMSPNVKGKTIILANPSNLSQQKTFLLRSVGPDGNTVYQQVPISSVAGLQNLTGNNNINNMILTTTQSPGIIKTTQPQQIQIQQQQPQFQQIQTTQSNQQQLPALVPTSYTPMVITSTQNVQQQRPLLVTTSGQGMNLLPQGLTLIQRPGQQAQLVQTIQQPQTIRLQQQPQIVQIQQPQQQQLQLNPQRTTIVTTQPQQPRKGLSLSNEHVAKLNEIFSQANRVTRRDKALILGFMGGCRENPMPSPENYIVIKLGETEERVQQEDGSIQNMLVESLIKLDYNTGEWKKLQHLRHIDQSNAPNETKKIPAQNSVVI